MEDNFRRHKKMRTAASRADLATNRSSISPQSSAPKGRALQSSQPIVVYEDSDEPSTSATSIEDRDSVTISPSRSFVEAPHFTAVNGNDVPTSRRSGRTSTGTQPNPKYLMNFHPSLDTVLRPKRANKILGQPLANRAVDEAIDSDDEYHVSTDSASDEDDRSDTFAADDIVTTSAVRDRDFSKTPTFDVKATRRSKRFEARKPVVYDARIHPSLDPILGIHHKTHILPKHKDVWDESYLPHQFKQQAREFALKRKRSTSHTDATNGNHAVADSGGHNESIEEEAADEPSPASAPSINDDEAAAEALLAGSGQDLSSDSVGTNAAEMNSDLAKSFADFFHDLRSDSTDEEAVIDDGLAFAAHSLETIQKQTLPVMRQNTSQDYELDQELRAEFDRAIGDIEVDDSVGDYDLSAEEVAAMFEESIHKNSQSFDKENRAPCAEV